MICFLIKKSSSISSEQWISNENRSENRCNKKSKNNLLPNTKFGKSKISFLIWIISIIKKPKIWIWKKHANLLELKYNSSFTEIEIGAEGTWETERVLGKPKFKTNMSAIRVIAGRLLGA